MTRLYMLKVFTTNNQQALVARFGKNRSGLGLFPPVLIENDPYISYGIKVSEQEFDKHSPGDLYQLTDSNDDITLLEQNTPNIFLLSYDTRTPDSLEKAKSIITCFESEAKINQWGKIPIYLIGLNADNLEQCSALEAEAKSTTDLVPIFVSSLFTDEEAKNLIAQIKTHFLSNGVTSVPDQATAPITLLAP